MTERFEFTAWQPKALVLSGLVILVSVMSLLAQGLTLGLDFTGGRLMEYRFSTPVGIETIESHLAAEDLKGEVLLEGTSDAIVVKLDSRVSNERADAFSQRVLAAHEGASLERVDFVGPKVGEELSEQGGMATLVALLCILIYVAFRFEWRFALGAVLALMHDVVITLGVFSVFHIEFDLSVLAAVLAVIGYSLNDTIVVYDRIRENFIGIRKKTTKQIINISLNQTLSRTLVTSITTLLVLIALFVWGGASIHNFSLALMVGVLIGTYSSVFIASTVILLLGTHPQHLIPKKVEGDGAQV